MSRPILNLQDNFLNQVRRDNAEITIVMLDGTQLLGRVKGFDNFTVIVAGAAGGEHLIYKHAIAQLVSAKPVVSATPLRPAGAGRPPRAEGGDRPRGPRPPRHEGGAPAAPQGESAPAAESAAPAADGGAAPERKPRPGEGFNKLDLSAIKKS